MAIVLKEQKRGVNWFAAIVFIFFFAVVIGGGYYLFFAETPGIEIVAPSVLQSTAEIADVQFDPSQVINHQTLKELRQFGSPSGIGVLGKSNPFISF